MEGCLSHFRNQRIWQVKEATSQARLGKCVLLVCLGCPRDNETMNSFPREFPGAPGKQLLPLKNDNIRT